VAFSTLSGLTLELSSHRPQRAAPVDPAGKTIPLRPGVECEEWGCIAHAAGVSIGSKGSTIVPMAEATEIVAHGRRTARSSTRAIGTYSTTAVCM